MRTYLPAENSIYIVSHFKENTFKKSFVRQKWEYKAGSKVTVEGNIVPVLN
jgi:hypothetical protein